VLGREALRDNFSGTLIALDVRLENRIEHIVRGQRILIGLMFTQLRRRRARDDAFRDNASEAVAIACETVDERLADVLQNGEAAGHVTVERRITDGHLGFVSRRQHDRAELVRQRHQQRAANARLNVLLGRIDGTIAELARQRLQKSAEYGLDRNLVVAHADDIRHLARIIEADRCVVS